MSTRSVIAFPTASGFTGRYCHFDGYPTGVGDALRTIVLRDGYTTAVRTLTSDHTCWSAVNARDNLTLRDIDNGGGCVAVPGYGVAYTALPGEPRDNVWITESSLQTWCEWVYVLGETSIELWLPGTTGWGAVGHARYDDPEAMARIEAEVAAADEAAYWAEQAAND